MKKIDWTVVASILVALAIFMVLQKLFTIKVTVGSDGTVMGHEETRFKLPTKPAVAAAQA